MILVVARRKKPRPYINTNIILDYIRNRNHDSVLLMETIKRRKIQCFTSYYTILELIDREQENKWIWKRAQHGEALDDIIRRRYPRELSEAELRDAFNEIENKFLKPFVDSDIVVVTVPLDESWDSLLELLQKGNFSIGDIFHLDAAIGNRCNIFITNDSQLVKMINETGLMSAARPAELDKKLAELGIRPIVLP